MRAKRKKKKKTQINERNYFNFLGQFFFNYMNASVLHFFTNYKKKIKKKITNAKIKKSVTKSIDNKNVNFFFLSIDKKNEKILFFEMNNSYCIHYFTILRYETNQIELHMYKSITVFVYFFFN